MVKMGDLNSKNDFSELLLELLNPLKPYYSEGCAQLKIGNTSAHYPNLSAWMEGFSRPLWGLSAFWAGGGIDEDFKKIYNAGFTNGTNPKSQEYWGKCWDYDQRLVEMAAIAFGLLFAPDQTWKPLNENEQKQLAEWLNEINHNKCCDNNWRFFNILVNIALKKLGQPYSTQSLKENLEFIESCYTGDGWYIDGPEGNTDYYIPFAMHYYSLIYAIVMEHEDPVRCNTFRKRAERFGKDFIYWFSSEGSSVPYGRSLTYRFAQSAFYSACVLAEIKPFSIEVMKGIIVRNLQYWLSKPILDNAGILTIGYCYSNLHMAENYNAPGSPYWAMKAFAVLAMKDDNEFWKCEKEPLPDLEEKKYLKYANMIIQRREDGNVIMLPGGRKQTHLHAHTEEKYSKFAYSSKFGFSVMRSNYTIEEAAPDSTLTFAVWGYIFTRGIVDELEVTEEKIFSEWSPLKGIHVQTKIIPTSSGHLRIHNIESEYDCMAYDAGFSLPIETPDACQLYSKSGEGKFSLLKAEPNTNLINSQTVIPILTYEIKKGRNQIETEVKY